MAQLYDEIGVDYSAYRRPDPRIAMARMDQARQNLRRGRLSSRPSQCSSRDSPSPALQRSSRLASRSAAPIGASFEPDYGTRQGEDRDRDPSDRTVIAGLTRGIAGPWHEPCRF